MCKQSDGAECHTKMARKVSRLPDWSEGKGDAVLRRTALRFEGVARPPACVCAGRILHLAGVRDAGNRAVENRRNPGILTFSWEKQPSGKSMTFCSKLHFYGNGALFAAIAPLEALRPECIINTVVSLGISDHFPRKCVVAPKSALLHKNDGNSLHLVDFHENQ